jgi:hypothetical protein
VTGRGAAAINADAELVVVQVARFASAGSVAPEPTPTIRHTLDLDLRSFRGKALASESPERVIRIRASAPGS